MQEFVAKWLIELSLLFAGSIVASISYYIKKVRNLDEDVTSLKQTIYGTQQEENRGHISRTSHKIDSIEQDIDHIDQKTDDIQNDMSRIEGKVNLLVDQIHTENQSHNSTRSDDD
jgi:chromosome segregation ATPase